MKTKKQKKVNPDYLSRLWVDDRGNLPVHRIKGNREPHYEGTQWYYTTPSGNTIINHPSSYGWPMCYHPSTLKIVVGNGWINNHRGTTYYRTSDGDLCVLLPKKHHVKFHGFTAIPGWSKKEQVWIVHHKQHLIDYHVRRHYSPSLIGFRKDARSAVLLAITAIKKRKLANIIEQKVKSGAVWVGYDDSINAGNCEVQTERFRKTISTRFDGEIGGLRADYLLSLRNDTFTNRAVKLASQRY